MWAGLINVGLGIWLMAAPAALDYGGRAAMNDWIVGPLIATAACVAIWEVTRAVRWINVGLGLWLVVAPFALRYDWPAMINSVAVGCAVVAFATVRGRLRHKFGGGWSALWRHSSSAAGNS